MHGYGIKRDSNTVMHRAKNIPTVVRQRGLSIVWPITLASAIASLLSASVLYPAGPKPVTIRASLSTSQLSFTSAQPKPDLVATAANSTPGSDELARALASAQSETDPDRQSQIELNVTNWLLAQGADAAIGQLNAQPSSSLLFDMETRFIRELAATDPRQAATAALRLNESGRKQALEGALIVWANQNLDDAIAWVVKLPEGTLKDGVERSVAYEAARTDPQAALYLVVSQDPSTERDKVLNYAVAQWAASDPKSATAWATQLQSSPLRDQAVASIAVAWAKTDPTAAAALALRSLPNGKDKADAVTGIVQRMTEADPQAAASWIAQFPEGPLRNTAEENMVKLWADQEPKEVATWLGTLPLTASRDVAVRAYAEQISPSNPSLAAQWAESITNSDIRNAEIKSLASLK